MLPTSLKEATSSTFMSCKFSEPRDNVGCGAYSPLPQHRHVDHCVILPAHHESLQSDKQTRDSSQQIDTEDQGNGRTFTNACQSDIMPFPDRNVLNVLGIFAMPFSWHCNAPTTGKFSARKKHSTASCRALSTSIDNDGRINHVRSNERPKAVRVVFSIPLSESYEWEHSRR